MNQLKYKVFEVLSRTLSVEAFEQWLYADPYVAEHITDDDLVLELMNVDYRSKDALRNIEVLCRQYFDEEGFLVAVVEYNCKRFLSAVSEEALLEMINNINHYYRYEDDYALMHRFYNAYWDMDLVDIGYYSMDSIISELAQYAQQLVDALEDADKETRKHILLNGIVYSRENPSDYAAAFNHLKQPKNIHKSIALPMSKPRKWWQFWR